MIEAAGFAPEILADLSAPSSLVLPHLFASGEQIGLNRPAALAGRTREGSSEKGVLHC